MLLTARDYRYDVCLVDTAGRMQGNEPLMRALAKLIKVVLGLMTAPVSRLHVTCMGGTDVTVCDVSAVLDSVL